MLFNVLYYLWYVPVHNTVYFYTFQIEDIDCFVDGECTQSLFVGEWPVEDAQECLETCQDHPGCQYFTYYGQEDACLGLANCVELDDKDCIDCYSGNRTCPGK